MKKLLLLVPFVFLSIVPAVHAQLREPNPAEQAAIDKMQHAIKQVFDAFGDDPSASWMLADDWGHDQVLVSTRPVVPLDLNTTFRRLYGTKHDSERAQKVLSPLQAQADAALAKNDSAGWQAIANKLNALMFVGMEAHINKKVITTPPPSKPNDATVAGATLVYKVEDDDCNWNDSSRGQCWLVAFGNWERSGYSANNYHQGYDFHFQHPAGTPYIENVVITMRGAPDRIAEIMKLPVWQQLSDALTK